MPASFKVVSEGMEDLSLQILGSRRSRGLLRLIHLLLVAAALTDLRKSYWRFGSSSETGIPARMIDSRSLPDGSIRHVSQRCWFPMALS